MSNRLEKLLFTVGLVDKASGPAGKVIASIDQITSRAQKGMQQIAAGGAGLFAVGYGLKSMLGPAMEMDKALGEVRSLDVAESALKLLEKTALSTAIKYGGSAVDIVRSSYDIQSAIAGLSDNELSKFTESSAILATATKSDAGTITDYMGTMYGIFQNTADTMGKAAWVQQLTGQTATAVQMFKTTGSEMAGAFANLGAEAQSHGVAMSEQMAILGQLQATMSGSEAGTKYKAFLAGVGKAQDELGLKFTDSQGKLLPMANILDKLRDKFGDTFDVAESDALKKAFGSKEATGLIKLLMQDTDGLSKNIKSLGDITGMDKAVKMASTIADPWERLSATGTAAKVIFGNALLPVLVPAAEWLIRMGEGVVSLSEKYPTLTRVIGFSVLSIVGLVAAFSAVSLISGIAGVAIAGFQTIMVGARIAALLFNAALWANPITWVVLGIAALVAAIAMAVTHWDTIKKTILDFGPFKLLGKALDWVIDKINMIPGINIGGSASIDFPTEGLGAAAGVDREASQGISRESTVPQGGLQQHISNRGTTIEKMEVNTTGGVNGYQLQDELMLAGG